MTNVARALDAATGESPTAIAALVREAWDGDPSIEDDRSTQRAILAHRSPDDVLEALPCEAIADLLERWIARLEADRADARRDLWDALDLARRPAVLTRIDPADTAAWAARFVRAIEASRYTTGPLFRSRAETYGSKALFEVPSPSGPRSLGWRQVAMRVDAIARGLVAVDPDGEPTPVALLSENRLEMALVDLACLTSGIRNVVIPANATEDDVAYMLRHSRARTVVTSSRRQLAKVLAARGSSPELRTVVTMTPIPDAPRDVLSLDVATARGESVAREVPLERSLAVGVDDVATVMYTSGTTGTPKGIRFSHRNIVSKRFCRALALPKIGDGDVLLAYLPLFHTFGRYLELLGAVFWGATYCFLENPSIEALVDGMRRHRPTVFISVPKKWIQLYETIVRRADPMRVDDSVVTRVVREVTGGRLAWGLSAAGHLNSEIFRFFQSQEIELMSGFGMTEATGGITMTRPGAYKDDSLGGALPGIELRLAEDGELWIRGPYVMAGYLDPPDGDEGFDPDGWFATGDLMERDRDGEIRLVDRKKEIYKNIKGETIAPQRVENLFRDFESVDRVFLVGDHREYNTALIHPEPTSPEIADRTPDELEAHFRSLVVSVNRFLSPYERIVDFALIDRDLDPERGELTAKGTPRRKTVERHFRETIARLYDRSTLEIGGVEVVVPDWLLQALGLTAQDVRLTEEGLALPGAGRPLLEIRALAEDRSRIGTCEYTHRPGPIRLGTILSEPSLWLGNHALVAWVRIDLTGHQRPGRNPERLRFARTVAGSHPDDAFDDAVRTATRDDDRSLSAVHAAAVLLQAKDAERAMPAVGLLERIADQEGPATDAARRVLGRAADLPDVHLRRRALGALLRCERDARFRKTLDRFLASSEVLLDDGSQRELSEPTLSATKLEALIGATRSLCAAGDPERDDTAASLLGFLAQYASRHPASVHRLREIVTRAALFAPREPVRVRAQEARTELQEGFRRWLGPNSRVAVDPDGGHEYRWEDVTTFDDDVESEDRSRIMGALSHTPMLREALFLFSHASVRLSDIAPRGVWVRALGSNHGKSVYRVTVQTRHSGAYDFAINVNHELDPEDVRQETEWLVLCGARGPLPPLVEDLGGTWPTYDLWTEEFIPGETLDRLLRRLSRREGGEERFRQLWPFLAWTSLAAYVDFWNRTGRRWEIADPGPRNVVAPRDDYQTGARLVSVSSRHEHDSVAAMLRRLYRSLIATVEADHPELKDVVGVRDVYSAFLEIVGEAEGISLLGDVARDDSTPEDERRELVAFVERIEAHGFRPVRLHFATERYGRWAARNSEATPQARARTVQELYDTYGLQRLLPSYPEARLRFFRDTVFETAHDALAQALDRVLLRLRNGEMSGEEVVDAIADLRAGLSLEADDDYFLARLSFPHLRPEDHAGFVDVDFGGRHQSEIVVTLEDRDGLPFRVRHALNPREVGRLHRLFVESTIDVRFRMEHQYLVAINERGVVVAGIYYEIEDGGRNAHLEKIVVADPYRKKGVADGLMHELFHRLRAAGADTVTTGFFRPEYFYGYGFTLDKQYAGLVKTLADPGPTSA